MFDNYLRRQELYAKHLPLKGAVGEARHIAGSLALAVMAEGTLISAANLDVGAAVATSVGAGVVALVGADLSIDRARWLYVQEHSPEAAEHYKSQKSKQSLALD